MDIANLRTAKRNRSEKVNSRKDGKSVGPEVKDILEFQSFPQSCNENGGKYVHKDGEGTCKYMRRDRGEKAYKNHDHPDTLGVSLDDKGECMGKFVEGKSKYKFRFGEEDKKPVEKSEFQKMLDTCWAEMNKYLSDVKSEETDSIQHEVDMSDDQSKRQQTDCANICTQCNSTDLFLNEQVGMICNSCSVVVQEIGYILPTLV